MRIRVCLVVISLALTACSPAGPELTSSTSATRSLTTSAATTTIATAPPVTSTAPPTTVTTPRPGTEITGALPDGTPYTVVFDTPVDRTVEGISAAIMIDLEDGTSRALGRTVLNIDGDAEPGLDQLGRYRVPAGDGYVTISVDETVTAQVGDVEALLMDAIAAGTRSKLPTLELAPPLRWATDGEIPLQMEVVYTGFVVRRGCEELAIACNDTGAVQVIPADRVFSSAPALPAEPVWIESPAPRPQDNAAYLDPGPLSIRAGHDVMWTGTEMIVWGGAQGDRLPHLIDGAAFDPATNTWRLLAPIPLESSKVTRAVWADQQMIVVSREATLGYDPTDDSWSVIGDGLYPPEVPGFLVWTGKHVAAWTSSGIHTFDPSTGKWAQLPDLGFGRSAAWEGALLVLDGNLVAVGLAPEYCSGRRIAIWDGSVWDLLPETSLQANEYAECAWPNQTATVPGRLFIWEDNIHLTKVYDTGQAAWREVATIPLGGTEGDSGAVPLDDGTSYRNGARRRSSTP